MQKAFGTHKVGFVSSFWAFLKAVISLLIFYSYEVGCMTLVNGD